MPAVTRRWFEPPDTTTALPRRPFAFSQQAWDEAAAISAAGPAELYRRLLTDQESEAALLAARRVIDGFLRPAASWPLDAGATAGQVAAHVRAVAGELAAAAGALAGLPPEAARAAARQRAPLALLGACWLDVVSQPATQPAVLVNRLLAQHYQLSGAGNGQRAQVRLRRAALRGQGAYLPEISAPDFLDRAGARPLTVLHACFYLALSRLPANFLPEVAGVHYASAALGLDDLLCGTPPALAPADLDGLLACFCELAGSAERRRLHQAIALTLDLEREHVAMLAELAAWRAELPLEAQVAQIVARHAPLAGGHHGAVRVGGRLLADAFGDPGLDLAQFLADFRESPQLRPAADGSCRFIRATKLGGPMFGIFDEREAAVLAQWAAAVASGERPAVVLPACTAGDGPAARRAAAVRQAAPADTVAVAPREPGDRELFYQLVNIENHASVLPLAAERAERTFAAAEIMFTRGAGGRYTDASFFDYSPAALLGRAERIYWDKLVSPYRPLTEIPDRDEVVFRQMTFMLTYLIDGAWLHRLGNTGHDGRESDALLADIYADEMGRGDLRKNHIMLVHRALASMGVRLPHIRDEAFIEQDEVPDDLYGFSIHQLCMCLFPDRFYNEILGYNLAIEMFGAGEARLHEVQRLRHHGIDDCYERAHLTIDNFSAGHARQAADIIISYLDSVRRTVGAAAVPGEWRRVWRGYAAFAYFLEQPLLREIAPGGPPAPAQTADLII